MKAIVLAGGEGQRLRPLTQSRPKPLLPVAGRPCVDFVLRSLVNSGVREIVITTAYMSDRLIRAIAEGLGYDASILYSFEGTPAGTAGSVKRVANFIDDTFVVAMGDVLVDLDLRPLIEFHRRKKSVATIALTEVEDPTEYGIVGLDKGGRIQRFKEKPSREEAFSNLANAGIYVLEPEVLDLIPDDRPCDFSKDVFPAILAKGLPLHGMKIEGVWVDIGRPRDLVRASLEVLRREGKEQRLLGIDPFGPAIVGKGLQLEPDVRLAGPGEHQVFEAPASQEREQRIGDATDVAGTMVVHVALHPHLRPATLLVTSGHLIGDVGDLLDPAELDQEQTRVRVIHQRQARRPVGLQEHLEREQVGLWTDGHPVAEGPRRGDELP